MSGGDTNLEYGARAVTTFDWENSASTTPDKHAGPTHAVAVVSTNTQTRVAQLTISELSTPVERPVDEDTQHRSPPKRPHVDGKNKRGDDHDAGLEQVDHCPLRLIVRIPTPEHPGISESILQIDEGTP